MIDEDAIRRHVGDSLAAYTERTNRPPVPGVCECYTNFTGIRLVLRRPCPVHGTESDPVAKWDRPPAPVKKRRWWQRLRGVE